MYAVLFLVGLSAYLGSRSARNGTPISRGVVLGGSVVAMIALTSLRILL